MKDDRTSDDHASTDEERTKVSRQVNLANNVQARYAFLHWPRSSYRRKSLICLTRSMKDPKSSSRYPSAYAAKAS